MISAAVATLLLAPAAAAAASGAPATCDDLLVTFTRDGVTGDDRAVALTAQSIERDAAGWEMVAWDSAEGTQLTAVIATDRTGRVSNLAPAAVGVAEQVTSLTFCGTTAAPADADAEVRDGDDGTDPDAVTDAPDEDGAAATEAPATDAGTSDEPASAVAAPEDVADVEDRTAVDADAERTTDGAGEDPADTRDERPAAEADADVRTDSGTSNDGDTDGDRTSSTADAGDGDQRRSDTTEVTDGTEADAGTEADEDTEVLGVRIVATPEVEDDTAADAGAPEDDNAGDDAAATTQPSEAQATLATSNTRPGLGLLDNAWLLLAVIAAGIAAGASAVRHRCAVTAGTNTTTSQHASRHTGDAGLDAENGR